MSEQKKALGADDAKLVGSEEAILKAVQNAVREAHKKRRLNLHKVGERLKMLRDEATRAKNADLPALFDQMNTQRALIEHQPDDALPDLRSPYFAHMELEEGEKRRHVLLGHRTFLDTPGYPIIDWRHAPVSRIFFNYREGEEYEEELPGRIAEGVVLKRHIVTIAAGQLVQVTTGEKNFAKDGDGAWQVDERGGIPRLQGGAGSATRGASLGVGLGGRPSAEVSALLDAEQFALLTSSPDEPLLVLGGAGCGKTTVALHRLASLNYQNPARFPQESMIVIVPEPGLVRLSRKLLDSLGLEKLAVVTFTEWIARQARFLIRGLPRRVYEDTPASVVRFKRHPALRRGIELLIEAQARELAKNLAEKMPASDEAQRILCDERRPLVERIDRASEQYRAQIVARPEEPSQTERHRLKVVEQFFLDLRKRVLDVAGDRVALFTKREILDAVVEASASELTPKMADDVLRHSLDQFAMSSQRLYADFDASRLETVDGRSLMDDFQDEIASSIDAEDFAIAIELLRYKTGRDFSRYGKLQTYAHMVIDEAQELAPIELAVLGRSLKGERPSVTIAGDAAQQTDPSTSFTSWHAVLEHLGVPPVKANHLTTTYRSPRPIAAYAHEILGPLKPAAQPTAIRDGVPVSVSHFANDGHAAVFLTDALTTLMTHEPHASVAVITKEMDTAAKFYDALRDVPKIRLVHDGDFEFRPGIDLTDVSQVKGLEFDYVIIPDANALAYRDKPEDRRLLHVAATRAIHQLWVIAIGPESPILPQT